MVTDRLNCEAWRVVVPIEGTVATRPGIPVSAIWLRGFLRRGLDLQVDPGNKRSFPQTPVESWRLILNDDNPPQITDSHVRELSLDDKVARTSSSEALLPSETIKISKSVDVPIGAAALVALTDYGPTPYRRGAARIAHRYSDPGYLRLCASSAGVDRGSGYETRIAGISAVLIPEGRSIVIPQGTDRENLRYYRLTYNVGELLLKPFEPDDGEGKSENTDDDWGGHPRSPKDPLIRDEAAAEPEPDPIVTDAFPPRVE